MKPFRTFLQAWRQTSNSQHPTNALHSTDRMQGLLQRERMRSDRGNSTFALLSLTFSHNLRPGELQVVSDVLAGRIRATDDAGILARDRVGIILPETPVDGAWKLANDLMALLPQALRNVACDVFAYPNSDDPFDGTFDGSDEESAVPEPSVRATAHSGRRHAPAAGTMAMHRTQRPRSMTTLFVRPLPLWKRSIDVVVSGAALIVLSPLLLAVAAAIKLTSSGPIIFRQQRDTLGGRGFMIYKFRTMCVDAEARKAALRQLSEQDGPAFKIAKDPRVTRIGRILRSTSIDELPQLLNVFLGDMTLVGPRALPTRESNGCEPWQRRRLDVTAGITCIWQVRGRSAVTFAEWMRMDLQYIRTRSAANDLKLLAQTVPAVVIGRGAC
jgi:lipopolysaccharide/colanic/teichoic acid biosynthesis glycosyltransferase